MSSQPTPTYNFSGIDYNSSFFNKVKTSSSGLTQTQANALYLQKTVPDTATSLETFSAGINTDNILPITNNLNIGTSLTNINQKGQTVFTDLAPHCDVVPEYSNDLCNKTYVDSRISSGGQSFLYCNYSVGTTIKSLGTAIIANAAVTVINKNELGNNLIASFMTDTNVPYVTTIPAGVWELNQYGMVDQNSVGQLYYYFVLNLYRPSTATYIYLGQSLNSTNIDAEGTPSIYTCRLTRGSTACLLEDKIHISVYCIGTNSGTGHTYNSYYQGDYYSYFTCPLVSGSNLLGLTNSWVATNTFNTGIYTASINPLLVGSDISIAGTQTTGGLYFGTGGGTIRSGALYFASAASATSAINFLSGSSAGGSVNIATASNTVAPLPTSTVNISTGTTTGTVTIGNPANTVQINGSLTLAKPLTLGSIPTATGQLGWNDYSTSGGYVACYFKTGNIEYMYASLTLPPGTYMLSMYTAIYTTCTYFRQYLVSGSTAFTDPTSSGTGATARTTFCNPLTVPSNGGNCILVLPSGVSASSEFSTFGIATITAGKNVIGASIQAVGVPAVLSGTYSLQYIRIA